MYFAGRQFCHKPNTLSFLRRSATIVILGNFPERAYGPPVFSGRNAVCKDITRCALSDQANFYCPDGVGQPLSISVHLLLPRRFHEAMLQHAQAELPNECCGLLGVEVPTGERSSRVAACAKALRLAWSNEAASPTEYLSEPRSMFEAEKDRRKHGYEFLAIYHSHPTSEPVPSKTDLARNYSPDVLNFIISLRGTEPLMCAAGGCATTGSRRPYVGDRGWMKFPLPLASCGCVTI